MALRRTRKSKKGHGGGKGKAVYIDMAVWHDKRTGHIHLAAPKEEKLHATVSGRTGSERYHRPLYEKLKAILKREKRWP